MKWTGKKNRIFFFLKSSEYFLLLNQNKITEGLTKKNNNDSFTKRRCKEVPNIYVIDIWIKEFFYYYLYLYSLIRF